MVALPMEQFSVPGLSSSSSGLAPGYFPSPGHLVREPSEDTVPSVDVSWGNIAKALLARAHSEDVCKALRDTWLDKPQWLHHRLRNGIPPRFRWLIWKTVVGFYERPLPDYSALGDIELQDQKTRREIEQDLHRTFPEETFGPEQQICLRRILTAYALHDPNVGYCQGMNFVVGFLLLVSDSEQETFGVFVCLMEDYGLSGFYEEGFPKLNQYCCAFDLILSSALPDLRAHFTQHNVGDAQYVMPWLQTVFVTLLPLPMVMRLWDAWLCEGPERGLAVTLRITVLILKLLKNTLVYLEPREISIFLRRLKETNPGPDGCAPAWWEELSKHCVEPMRDVEIPEHLLRHGSGRFGATFGYMMGTASMLVAAAATAAAAAAAWNFGDIDSLHVVVHAAAHPAEMLAPDWFTVKGFIIAASRRALEPFQELGADMAECAADALRSLLLFSKSPQSFLWREQHKGMLTLEDLRELAIDENEDKTDSYTNNVSE